MQRSRTLGQHKPAHAPRHREVGEQEVYPVRRLPQYLQRLLTAPCRKNPTSERPQVVDRKIEHALIIIHSQNCLRSIDLPTALTICCR
jgi:hypothetical protein